MPGNSFHYSILDDYINASSYWSNCNKFYRAFAPYNDISTEFQSGDIWFVKTDYIREFYSKVPNDVNINVVLGHSDDSFTDTLFKEKPTSIRKIFSPNNSCIDECSIPIPLGLSPPPPTGHGAPLGSDIKQYNIDKPREKLLYVNFRYTTYIKERKPLWNYYKSINSSSITVEDPDPSLQSFDKYASSMINHKFSLCPRGNGIDTHRLWESLYFRTIPVVKYDIIHRNWTDLPILFVHDWSEVTEEFLNTKYEEMKNTSYNFEKLTTSYWATLFKNKT